MDLFKQIDLGLVSFEDGLKQQHKYHRLVTESPEQGFLICCEHYPTLSMGLHASRSDILAEPPENVTIAQTDRGGKVTAHMPGQLVVYPILHLKNLKLQPKSYVGMLEEAVLVTLALFSINGQRNEAGSGVWVDNQKIAAIGIRIKQRVCYHGLSLNVSNSHRLFQTIHPCGLQGLTTTSIREVTNTPPSMNTVMEAFVSSFSSLLQAHLLEKSSFVLT